VATDTDRLDVRVLTPAGPVFVGSASMVFAPSRAGEVGMLPRHEPMTCTLGFGRTRVRSSDGGEEVFATSEGFLTIDRDQVLILVEQAVPVHEIDRAQAQADLRAAEEALESVGEDEVARNKAESEKQRAENLLNVADLHK
jgi:F-type H+-transporting ATPase subunit epsilon